MNRASSPLIFALTMGRMPLMVTGSSAIMPTLQPAPAAAAAATCKQPHARKGQRPAEKAELPCTDPDSVCVSANAAGVFAHAQCASTAPAPPFAKKAFVAHTQKDTASILRMAAAA